MNKRTQITFFFLSLNSLCLQIKVIVLLALSHSFCLPPTPSEPMQHQSKTCPVSLPPFIYFAIFTPSKSPHYLLSLPFHLFFFPILSFPFFITPHYHGSNDILEPHCRMKPLTPFPRAGNQPFTVEKAKIATILSPILVIFSTLSLKAPAPRIM